MSLPTPRRGMVPVFVLALAGLLMLAACTGDDDDADAGNGGDNDESMANGDGEEPVATAGDLEVFAPVVRFTLGDNAAGYFTVRNTGDDDDRLVSAESDVAGMVQLHETVTDGGSSSMQEIDGGVTIPAGGEATFSQGANHVMFMDMEDPLEDGDDVTITLTFENAGDVEFTVTASQMGGDSEDAEDGS